MEFLVTESWTTRCRKHVADWRFAAIIVILLDKHQSDPGVA